MLFNLHGKNNNHTRTIRVHAESAEEAERIGFGQGLFVTEVTPVQTESGATSSFDRVAGVVWKSWRSARMRSMKCFGREVTSSQFTALLMLGCATWIVDLCALHLV